MVVIRLSRCGAKKKPFYRIVATDSRNKRDGRFIEQIGYYNPMDKKTDNAVRIDMEALDKWVSNGAQMSDRVAFLAKKLKKDSAPAPEAKPAAKKASPAKPKAATAKKAPAKKAKKDSE